MDNQEKKDTQDMPRTEGLAADSQDSAAAADMAEAAGDAAGSGTMAGDGAAVEAEADTEADGAEDSAAAGDDAASAADGEDAAAAEETSEVPSTEEDAAAEAPPQEPDWKGMYARTMADFDNYRKRMARDREELFKSAARDVLKDILPTVDDLSRALGEAVDRDDPFVKGVQLVYDNLVKMLASHGATPIDSLGEPLDTGFHEAIATLPSPDVPEGHVMNEVTRGWMLNAKVLREAKVVVSSGKGE